MSTTRGIRTTIGVALASSVFLLAGCSSSGSVGGKSAAGSDKSSSAPAADSSSSKSSGGDSSPSSDSSSSASDSSSSSDDSLGGLGGEDPGCQAALEAASNAMKNLNPSDPAGAKKAIQDIATQMHAAAGKSKKPEAAAAINKLADDYSNFANQLGKGMPDTSALQADGTALGNACA
ncbi:MAG: hypothetical protein HOW97_38350 [Catenulispora sp.]|nr:hypothetical protein [Catenulispora sp.]